MSGLSPTADISGHGRDFDVVAVLTQGGPLRTTEVFATYAFAVGTLSSDMSLAAIVVVTKSQANFPDSALPVARC
jgi:ABC-type sugar transport system permease subunit